MQMKSNKASVYVLLLSCKRKSYWWFLKAVKSILRLDQEIFKSQWSTLFSPDRVRNIESHVPVEVLDKMTHFKSVIHRFSLHKLWKPPDYSHPAAVGLCSTGLCGIILWLFVSQSEGSARS